MDKILNHLKNKKAGYYFVMAISLLSLIQLIIYLVAFLDSQWESYFDISIVIFSSLAFLSGLISLVIDGIFNIKEATHFGGGLCLLFNFLSFLMFNRYGYMYYSQVFFGGIEFRLIISMYYGYLYSLIIYIIVSGLGIASCFMKHDALEGE